MSDKNVYPKRASHFAHKYCRLLFKSCACQEIGHHAVTLCCHVAHTEDAARYQGAVTFWNEQLMHTLGLTHRKQLTKARTVAIEHGWLHYERKHARAVGRYWATIPSRVTKYDDAPIEDLSLCTSESTEAGLCTPEGTEVGTEVGTPPNPSPNPKDKRSTDVDPASNGQKYKPQFTTWWSHYPRKVGKRKAAAAYDRAAKAAGHDSLLTAVKEFSQSDKARSEYCPHPTTWLNEGRYEDDPAEWRDRNGSSSAPIPEQIGPSGNRRRFAPQGSTR